ncbi:Na+/H+ antiporter subunit E [Roseibacillus persicicus]|uniref:Na+/H+ antiporter subunit E n=1 Tax=Roseibacillus persicicus TaxID=454148 RepID=UPI00280D93F8|nr:Na+/H+ antiporter subunit E [Roseibacillus persicicus]MDQ8189825.1 Na+/H+ antiporter subunit E [Roseibacillus persicicus]
MKSLLIFPLFYLKEVLTGSLLVARDVLFPRQRIAPVLLNVPLQSLTPRQRLLLACLISMTPGTISVAEEEGGRTMNVHSLYGANDPQPVIDHLKSRYESIVAKLPI